MADKSERMPLSADYIHKVHEDAKRAVSDLAYRRRWGETKSGSPISTLALCEEIARLNLAIEANESAQTRE